MKRFGPSWGAPACDEHSSVPLVATPVGELCLYCNFRIQEGDQGLILPHLGVVVQHETPCHLFCFLRVLGLDDEALAHLP